MVATRGSGAIPALILARIAVALKISVGSAGREPQIPNACAALREQR